MVFQTQGRMHSTFLAPDATPSLIKFIADPEHPSVDAGKLVNNLLPKWKLLYLKQLPMETASMRQKNFCPQNFTGTPERENICSERASEHISLGI